jgi:hypothetical protein
VAKLTLSFKQRSLKVFTLKTSECVIGRDEACDAVIDSLAVQPRHARILTGGETFILEPLEGSEVLVNNQPVAGPHELRSGDLIQLGKHTLRFSADQEISTAGVEYRRLVPSVAAWLQILNGTHLGRTIRLDKAFTRIGRSDANLAVIARRDDGYYLAHLGGDTPPRINGQDIGEKSTRLHNDDVIAVGELTVQFFTEDSHEPIGEGDEPQRWLDRIPLRMPAVLATKDESYPVDLIDISPQGALVKVSAALSPDCEDTFRLSFNLETGQHIEMLAAFAHQNGEHLGLRCISLSDDCASALKLLTQQHGGDSG